MATSLTLIPAEDLAVVVLTNGGHSVRATQELLMKALLPKWTTPPQAPHPAEAPVHPIPELTGVWIGEIHTYAGDRPFKLECLSDGNIHLRVGNQPVSLLSEVRFEKGWLEGTAQADLGTGDLDRHQPYQLRVLLKLRGTVLNGSITATRDDPRPFALTHWAQLQKQP